GGGWVDVAPTLPGDLHVVELDGAAGWCIARGCWLASAIGVELATQWDGFRTLVGGEGGFLMHVSGTGPVVISCYGALDVVILQAGEYVTLDTGHVVAYADSVQSRVRSVSQGVVQSVKSGEGLVVDFAGPGQVLTQTRNPRRLISWLQEQGLGSRS
ncbi:MAG: TIGR00266 family protein, partial [Actinomycetota bacterium]|nr:TIGR00266 family protein [Actinomycetota bacterium]